MSDDFRGARVDAIRVEREQKLENSELRHVNYCRHL